MKEECAVSEPTQPMVEHEDRDGIRVVRVREPKLGWEVDPKLLKVAMLEPLEGATRAAIDLSEVHYVASPTIGILLGVSRQAASSGCRLVFYGMQPYVRDTFRALKLDRILTIHDTLQDAFAFLTE